MKNVSTAIFSITIVTLLMGSFGNQQVFAGGCLDDSQCEGLFGPCTPGVCDLQDNNCKPGPPIPECCDSDDQCQPDPLCFEIIIENCEKLYGNHKNIPQHSSFFYNHHIF